MLLHTHRWIGDTHHSLMESIDTCLAGEESELKVRGLFYGIGHQPNSHLFKDDVELDEGGYVKVEPDLTHLLLSFPSNPMSFTSYVWCSDIDDASLWESTICLRKTTEYLLQPASVIHHFSYEESLLHHC